MVVICSLAIVGGWLETSANNSFRTPKTAELTAWQTRGAPGDEVRLILSTVAEAKHLAATSDQWNTPDHEKMNVTKPFNSSITYRLLSNVNSDTVWCTTTTLKSQQTWTISTSMWEWQSQRSHRPSSSTRRPDCDYRDSWIQDRRFCQG